MDGDDHHQQQQQQGPSSPSPSTISTASSDETSGASSDADQEWDESLQQLQLTVNMILLPFLGKWVGRRFAYYVWSRYMEWRYPVDIYVRSRGLFEAAGLLSAASSSV